MKSSAQGEYISKLKCEKQGEVCSRREGQHREPYGQRHERDKDPDLLRDSEIFFLLVTWGAFSCAGPNIRTS